VVEVEPDSGQGRRDLGGIGIQGAAHQQLGAHTDDLRCFALHCFAFFSGDLRDIGQLQVHAAVFGNVILAALQIIAQQQIEHPGGLLHIGGGDPDEPAGFGVHGGQPHHFGLVFAQSLAALERILGLGGIQITAKNDTYFAYSDAEKAKICRDLDAAKTKYSLQRSKGLGENEAEMMWLTTMNPETRRLIRVTPADVEETARMFDLLLGDNLQGRKDYIAENGSMYLELADIS
jgi:hypothetical protein